MRKAVSRGQRAGGKRGPGSLRFVIRSLVCKAKAPEKFLTRTRSVVFSLPL